MERVDVRALLALPVTCGVLLGAPAGAAQEPGILPHHAEVVVEAAVLGTPSSLVVGPNGTLVVADPSSGLVRISETGGDNLRPLEMDAPSEGVFPHRLGWSGGRIWVLDRPPTTAVFIDGRGTVVSRTDVDLPGRAGAVQGLRVLGIRADENLVVETAASGLSLALADPRVRLEELEEWFPPQIVPTGAVDELPVWLTSPAGSVLDTIATLKQRHRVGVARFSSDAVAAGEARITQFSQPFADHDVVAVDPASNRLAVVDRMVDETRSETHYRVRQIQSDGELLWDHAYEYEPVPLDPEVVRGELNRLAGDSEETRALRVAALRDRVYLPAWLPPVTSVRLGVDGWTWVRREAGDDASHVRWDILSPEGRRLGAVRLPSALTVWTVRGLEAWATAESATGVHLWRITVAP